MSKLSIHQQQQWAAHIQAWGDSGHSQLDYCREHGLKPHQFWYWKRKLTEPHKPETTGKLDRCLTKESDFVPVTMSSPVYSSQGLVLSLPGGISLSGITGDNVSLAQQLAEVLGQ